LNKEQVGPLKWTLPDEAGLTKFLVDEQGFNPERVASNIEKLKKAHAANSKPQSRLDSFFTVKSDPLAAKKRKERQDKEKKAAAAAKKKQKSKR
jgi:flap endonuclease-1